MNKGYFPLWRKFKDNFLWLEDREMSRFEAWLDLISEAQHTVNDTEVIFGATVLKCKYGETLKSIDTWARRWKWSRSRVHRFLKTLEKCNMIRTKSEQKTTRITICNYAKYDIKRNANETETKRKRNVSETQADTDNNVKNDKNEKNEKIVEIISYLNRKGKVEYSNKSPDTRKLVMAIISQGYSIDDIKGVLDLKIGQWFNDQKMRHWIRPKTLFNPQNFESYIHEFRARPKSNGLQAGRYRPAQNHFPPIEEQATAEDAKKYAANAIAMIKKLQREREMA